MRRSVHVLALATVDPRTPWYARTLASLVIAYALSPIDLIPDFIPVLGLLDDLLLLPLGIALVIRLVPDEVWREALARAEREEGAPRRSVAAAVVIVVLWIVAAVLAGRAAAHRWR